jgi:crossover junction endodeoxyribonuclease RuvC
MASVLGIDPGMSGGWALVDASGNLLDAGPFPIHTVKKSSKTVKQLDGRALAQVLAQTNATQAYVEQVSSRPRQAGQFQFGINTGMIHGILHALQMPFDLVSPLLWKPAYGIKRDHDETKASTKTRAREIAAKVFPAHSGLFARVKDDGVAEAALIALYGVHLLMRG